MAPQGSGRIVGGTETGVNELPYQALIRIDQRYLCGGTLISSLYVLTAAHCTIGFSPTQIKVTLGEHYNDGRSIGQTYSVVQIQQHASYDDDTGIISSNLYYHTKIQLL